ncbi:carboxymuconolactone decarboxylase family protein [Xylophilus ampelinus]|uniref:Putative peroxidase-related enzyme n=1 Tax=Xylophilus ampelinus TaxID=54067 RepID=A0A318SEZ9_9BURK|nr:carboxymuconolactone decarboxylase family protein [Xylophilus ampelinus]MCS4510883.1 carboxymuconolactone decarboxylase family protein [Xylophilus ampelinus]PYE76136.1 putative peroxidase-related enzyme [Xylophilus ampelinus]
MTRLALHTAATAPDASRPAVERAATANGFLPNLVGILANAPVALEAYQTVSQINGRAALSLAEREVVQITAARVHGCDFCVAGHSKIARRQAGLDAATVRALQVGGDTGQARLDALRVFAEAVIATRGQVPDAALQAFRAAGLGDQEALEVVLGISLATLCNFANSLAQSPVNPELQPWLPGGAALADGTNAGAARAA